MRHRRLRARVALLAALLFCDFTNARAQGWTQPVVPLAAPAPFDGAAIVRDSRRDRMVEVGGAWLSFNPATGPSIESPERIWSFSPADSLWQDLGPASSNTTPNGFDRGAAAYDSLADRVYAFGGAMRSRFGFALFNYSAALWQLDLGAAVPAWQVVPVAAGPVARTGAVLAFDPTHRRLVLHAGRDSTGAALSDTWTLDVDTAPAWTRVALAGAPPGREFAASVVDRARDRLVITGGEDLVHFRLSDAWTLDLATLAWSPLAATGGPAGIQSGTLDAARDRMLALVSEADSVVAWQLAFAPSPTWTRLMPGGFAPPARFPHYSALYDPATDQLIDLASDFVPYEGYAAHGVVHALHFAPLPLVNVTATMTASYDLGHTLLAFDTQADGPLYGRVAVETVDGTSRNLVFLDPGGHTAVEPAPLTAGTHYDFRLRWFDGQAMRSIPFPLDTPPAPAHLDITIDRAGLVGDTFDLEWAVPGDSAHWLAPLMIERKDNSGPWRQLFPFYPHDGKITFFPYNDTSGDTVSHRLTWGPTFTEHVSPVATIVTPLIPDLVASGGNSAAAVIEWRLPPGMPFAGTLYRAGSNIPEPVGGPHAPDANGLLHFEDAQGAARDGSGEYTLGWDVGGTPRYSAHVLLTTSGQNVDLLQFVHVDSTAVTFTWLDPEPFWTVPLVFERANGTGWDSLATLVPGLPAAKRAVSDDTVVPGQEYLYRLRWPQSGLSYVHSLAFDISIPRGSAPVDTLPFIATLGFGGPATNLYRGTVALVVTTPAGAPASFDLYDATGRRVRGQALSPAWSGTVSLEGLKAGVYFARIAARGESRVRKLVLVP